MTFFLPGFTQNYRERWGLDDAEVRSRVWARVPQIIFQEVPAWPLYAIVVGLGAGGLAAFALRILGDLFLFNGPVIYYCIWWPLSALVGIPISGLVAKPLGGEFWVIPMVTTAVCEAAVFGGNVARLYFANKLPVVGKDTQDTLVLLLIMGMMYFMLMALFVGSGLNSIEQYRLSSVRSLTESQFSSSLSPLSSLSGHFSPLAFVLLVASEGVYAYLSRSEFPDLRTVVLKDALTIIVLALTAIITVNLINASLIAGNYAWHWRAFSTTAIPTVILHAVVIVTIALIWGTGGHASRVGAAFLRACQIGAAGSLSAYFALRKAQQYVYNREELEDIYELLVIPRPKKVDEADEADEADKAQSDETTDPCVSVQAD